MFHPEFRYLLTQEERDNEIMPFICGRVFTTIFVKIIYIFALYKIWWMAYDIFEYSSIVSNYIWTALWDSLTLENQLFDLVLIVISIVAGISMLITLNEISNSLDREFTKLNDDIKEKNQRIHDLESKLLEISNSKNLSVKLTRNENPTKEN